MRAGSLSLASCAGIFALLTLRSVLASPSASAGAVSPRVAPSPALAAGSVRLVTYNVAGLPAHFSGLHPREHLPLIGKFLNAYDVALVQEDYAYPGELRQGLAFSHSSPAFVRGTRHDFGDGLSLFSRLPFSGFEREAWSACNGYLGAYFDCLTPKGFSFSRLELAPGVFVDLYNLHMDAGPSSGDVHARAAQFQQLAAAIARRSPGHALIVAGDTNVRGYRREALRAFEEHSGLSDACEVLHCPDPRRIDRVFVRSSTELELRPTTWRTESTFIDAQGEALSDHLPVSVDIAWRVRAEAR